MCGGNDFFTCHPHPPPPLRPKAALNSPRYEAHSTHVRTFPVFVQQLLSSISLVQTCHNSTASMSERTRTKEQIFCNKRLPASATKSRKERSRKAAGWVSHKFPFVSFSGCFPPAQRGKSPLMARRPPPPAARISLHRN